MIRCQHSLFTTPYTITTTHHNNNYYYSTNTTSPPIAPSRLTGCHPAPTRHCHECGLHPTSCDFIFPPPVKLYEVSSHRRVIWATAASLPARCSPAEPSQPPAHSSRFQITTPDSTPSRCCWQVYPSTEPPVSTHGTS